MLLVAFVQKLLDLWLLDDVRDELLLEDLEVTLLLGLSCTADGLVVGQLLYLLVDAADRHAALGFDQIFHWHDHLGSSLQVFGRAGWGTNISFHLRRNRILDPPVATICDHIGAGLTFEGCTCYKPRGRIRAWCTHVSGAHFCSIGIIQKLGILKNLNSSLAVILTEKRCRSLFQTRCFGNDLRPIFTAVLSALTSGLAFTDPLALCGFFQLQSFSFCRFLG